MAKGGAGFGILLPAMSAIPVFYMVPAVKAGMVITERVVFHYPKIYFSANF